MSRSIRPGRTAPILPLVLAWLLTAAPGLHAEMVLDRSILVFDGDDAGRQDVEVTNTGAENLYLDTEILRVTDPGTEQEARVEVEDPGAAGLLVTPARMVVPPEGRRLVRVVPLEERGETDRIYRVNLLPVVPPLTAETTAVKVVVAYQLLVILRPRDPQPDLVWTRDGDRIRFRNQGNTNVLLYNGSQCPEGIEPGSEECVDIGVARRLYAGNEWELDLPLAAPVEFTATVGKRNVRRRFD
jgi:P pilus assembly chaperone PapD